MDIGRNKDGTKLTNVEIIKTCYDALKRLKDATPEEYGEAKARQMHNDFVQIAGMTPNGADPAQAERVYQFYEQIATAPDYNTANKLYMDNIINNINH